MVFSTSSLRFSKARRELLTLYTGQGAPGIHECCTESLWLYIPSIASSMLGINIMTMRMSFRYVLCGDGELYSIMRRGISVI